MKEPEHKRLAAAVDRELKQLREVPAPESLIARVLDAITHPVPWYRRAWPTWSGPQRILSLAVLVAVFATLCAGAWYAGHLGSADILTRPFKPWLALGSAFVSAGHAIWDSALVVLKGLGTWFLVGCVAAAGTGYLICMGLGTVAYRMAWPRR